MYKEVTTCSEFLFLVAANNILPSSCRATSGHHNRGQRDCVSRLPCCPHLPRQQHSQLQSHMAERRSWRSSGPTCSRLDQPLASAVPCDPRSVRLVWVRRYKRGRGDSRAALPHCGRWGVCIYDCMLCLLWLCKATLMLQNIPPLFTICFQKLDAAVEP